MTEPDEAILYARQKARQRVINFFEGDEDAAEAELDRLETEDAKEVLGWFAEDYRAGQAASAERIKALERLLREIKPVAHLFQWNDLRDQIEALLEEADQ